jgi:Domain of unknown function (DUF1816)
LNGAGAVIMQGIFLFSVYFILVSLVLYYLRSNRSLKWWVKIDTKIPTCTYYFGPFDSEREAEAYRGDYIQDLQEEGAKGIYVKIQRCKPQELTIFEA